MTSTICILAIVLIAMIGIALVLGGDRPVKTIAVIFTVVGMWVGTTDPGKSAVSALGHLIKAFT